MLIVEGIQKAVLYMILQTIISYLIVYVNEYPTLVPREIHAKNRLRSPQTSRNTVDCVAFVADNGGGMDPDKMRQCMSLGYSAKSRIANTIGQCKAHYNETGAC